MKTIIGVFTLLFSAFSAAAPLHSIVMLGDSLSDNGNLYEYTQHQLPESPPYYKGRFTNGPAWIELLTDLYFPGEVSTHLEDYAFGGAGVSEDTEENVLFTLHREVSTYLLAHQNKADPDSLFVVWIGANNYLAGPEDGQAEIRRVVDGTRNDLQLLADAGAQHFLIVNLPDLGNTPGAVMYNAQAELSYLSLHHNEALATAVNNLRENNPQLHWVLFDVNALMSNMSARPEDYGFDNTTGMCNNVMKVKRSPKALLQMSAEIKRIPGLSCDGFMFFDSVHPTEPAHQIMANEAHELLVSSGVEFSAK